MNIWYLLVIVSIVALIVFFFLNKFAVYWNQKKTKQIIDDFNKETKDEIKEETKDKIKEEKEEENHKENQPE